ncbi:unnamed protein product [Caenorhabditis sp. 36 PRJEB53466]|nr:unnamed protein product [Caenorhabditis sp. 36 PRJEB53466]
MASLWNRFKTRVLYFKYYKCCWPIFVYYITGMFHEWILSDEYHSLHFWILFFLLIREGNRNPMTQFSITNLKEDAVKRPAAPHRHPSYYEDYHRQARRDLLNPYSTYYAGRRQRPLDRNL